MSFVFKGKGNSILFLAPEKAEITIPSHVKEIAGEGDRSYAFIKAHLILSSVTFPKGNLVEKISSFAFYDCNKLKTIDLSTCEHLESIGERAFGCCKTANPIILPNSLTTLGECAFVQCTALKTITIPPLVNFVGEKCFHTCTGMTEIIIHPDSCLKFFSKYALNNCNSLKSFKIPKSMESIENVFNRECESLVSVDVDANNAKLTSIDGCVYSKNTTIFYLMPPGKVLDNFAIPEGVTKIGLCSFEGSRVKNVTFPNSLVEIEGWAFTQADIVEAKFGPNTKIYGNRVFTSCISLIKAEFPDTVKTIGYGMFFNCQNLETCKLPNHFDSISGGIFSSCPKLKPIVDPESDLKIDEYGLAYINNKSVLILNFNETNENIEIPETVQTISNMVFINNANVKSLTFKGTSTINKIASDSFGSTSITELTFPPSLREIDYYAFFNCSKLEKVTFGDGLEAIGKAAFEECKALKTLTFGSGQFSLGECAFNECYNLSQINLGNGVKSIGYKAFAYCITLTEISLPSTLTTLNGRAFSKCYELKSCTIDKTAPLKSLPSLLFENCRKLTNVEFSDQIITIGTHCFTGTGLSNITIPQSLETVGDFAFCDCKALTTLIIPSVANLKNFSYGAFWGCYAFEKIENNSPEFSLNNGALYNKGETELIVVPPNTSVKFFQFPETLRIIYQSALLHCINIQQIFIPPNSVTEIQNNVFEDCFNLMNINIPESVKEIGEFAFKNCNKLQCGLLIENRAKEFCEKLVKVARMPEVCLIKCDEVCQLQRKNTPQNLFSFLVITLFLSD